MSALMTTNGTTPASSLFINTSLTPAIALQLNDTIDFVYNYSCSTLYPALNEVSQVGITQQVGKPKTSY